MKLLYCPKCQDVRKLNKTESICQCGKSGGWYSTDGLRAVIWGDAIPIGFCNSSFIRALQNRPQEEGMGERFEAFVIPTKCATITQWDLL